MCLSWTRENPHSGDAGGFLVLLNQASYLGLIRIFLEKLSCHEMKRHVYILLFVHFFLEELQSTDSQTAGLTGPLFLFLYAVSGIFKLKLVYLLLHFNLENMPLLFSEYEVKWRKKEKLFVSLLHFLDGQRAQLDYQVQTKVHREGSSVYCSLQVCTQNTELLLLFTVYLVWFESQTQTKN